MSRSPEPAAIPATPRRRRAAVAAAAVACVVLVGAVASPAGARSQEPDPADVVDAARDWHRAHDKEILGSLLEFLAIPNVASDAENIRRNAEWIVEQFAGRGLQAEILDTPGAPWVHVERPVPGAERTLIFYSHFDGQAADPSRWVGHDPWEPVLRNGSLAEGAEIVPMPEGPVPDDWRVYGRSASDDRGPIVMILAALDALEAAGIEPRANLKFLFEGEEEAGSPNVEWFTETYRDLLEADAMILADGPKHPAGPPTLVYGVRGIVTVQLTVYGPSQPLHSGHYGNWAPNPAMRLIQLLATTKDSGTGQILVPGWNDERVPLTDLERAALASIPPDPGRTPSRLGFAEPEGPWENRLEAVTYNSLNVRGMSSGWVGDEARTIVPDRAVAELDFRLVTETAPEVQVQRFVEHVRAQGFHVVEEEPDAETRSRHPLLARVAVREGLGYPATRTRMDLPVSRALISRLERAFDTEVIAIPTGGGSLPLYAFDRIGLPTISAPTVNHDNNQHSPNENLRIGNLWEGIETLAVLLTAE